MQKRSTVPHPGPGVCGGFGSGKKHAQGTEKRDKRSRARADVDAKGAVVWHHAQVAPWPVRPGIRVDPRSSVFSFSLRRETVPVKLIVLIGLCRINQEMAHPPDQWSGQAGPGGEGLGLIQVGSRVSGEWRESPIRR
ncbi:hypothetical protein DVDV_1379 [Desulfovibrio sp. DV]|nr:hypothetical protein DVDV_1379 [Desulfovibrio sp. DV]